MRISLVAVIIIALAFLTTAPAYGVSLMPGGNLTSNAEATRLDVEAYQAMFKVDQATAEREISEVPRIGALEATLEKEFPEAFAGVWIDHSPYRVVVAVTRRSQMVDEVVASAHLSGAVEIRLAPRSMAQLREILDTIAATAVPSDLSISVQENRVDVRTKSQAELVQRLPEQLLSDSSVHIDEVVALGRPAANIYGGLGGASNNWSGCPSGFTVKNNSTNVMGFLTAGHCGNTLSYQGVNLPMQAEDWDGTTDAQWHTAPGFSVQPAFIWNAAQNTRNVTSLANDPDFVIGMTLCKYGPAGGYACGTVDSKTIRPNWVPNATATYIRVANCNQDMVLPGDSGGPVFFGNKAFGIVSGYEDDLDPSCWLKNMLIFGNLGYIAYSLNVTPLKAP